MDRLHIFHYFINLLHYFCILADNSPECLFHTLIEIFKGNHIIPMHVCKINNRFFFKRVQPEGKPRFFVGLQYSRRFFGYSSYAHTDFYRAFLLHFPSHGVYILIQVNPTILIGKYTDQMNTVFIFSNHKPQLPHAKCAVQLIEHREPGQIEMSEGLHTEPRRLIRTDPGADSHKKAIFKIHIFRLENPVQLFIFIISSIIDSLEKLLKLILVLIENLHRILLFNDANSLPDCFLQIFLGHRLQEIVHRPVLQRLLGIGELLITADKNKFCLSIIFPVPVKQLQTGDIGHHNISQNNVRIRKFYHLFQLFPVIGNTGHFNPQSLPVHHPGQPFHNQTLIIRNH